jgi:hypothetical protein
MNISCFLLFLGGQAIKIIKMIKLCNAVFIQAKVDLLKMLKANDFFTQNINGHDSITGYMRWDGAAWFHY